MKLNLYILSIFTVYFFTACKTVRHATNRDSSGNETTGSIRKNEKREFLNGIQVTLGTTTRTRQKTTGIITESSTAEGSTSSKPLNGGTDIVSAHFLQNKYADILQVNSSQLENILLLELVDKWWGTRYCIGGSSENCIDCSALTQILLKEVYKLSIPRTAQEQYNLAERVELEDLREGDLVFFKTSRRRSITHVGVYLYNNKFVHASTSGGVTITDLNDKYWNPKFRGGGRINNN